MLYPCMLVHLDYVHYFMTLFCPQVQHLAVRCIQRNVKKYMLIREWPWWKLYTKVKPILNVHRTEEELLEAQVKLIWGVGGDVIHVYLCK